MAGDSKITANQSNGFEVLDMHDIDDQKWIWMIITEYMHFDTFFKDKIVNGKCIFDGIFTSGDYLALMLKEYLEKQEIVVSTGCTDYWI